tara:strand:- start:9191 stop:9502 length:312 start_codon:yes stop_codon:yes gene_type:complete
MKTFTILLCFFLCSCSASSFVNQTKPSNHRLKDKPVVVSELPVSDKSYHIVLDQNGEVVSTTPNVASSAFTIILYIILGCTIGCGIIYITPYFLKKIKKPDII